ncbi:MAG: acetyltransferase [Pegethrix bostrychoides GSE-TBD4-15B]|jgi:hypothetical protein|uniref:Acetyltransferase n=1 Tax=Pegethrix bostrychoides GSE-TBD4-15B TaxID=2839662 RepID=A0A951P7K5_9CYAN|nr:acetyltransferase [Pegethrix bostrychoides GSE-TBD4-15B]
MLLKSKDSDALIKVIDVEALINPQDPMVSGQVQNGEEEQDPEEFTKAELLFPSGEALPLCWFDADYKLNISRA